MARNKRKSQRDRRRYHVFRDQHGRRWGGVIEIDSGDPTGVLTPTGWAPPHPWLLPAAKYLHPVPDELGLLRIDYDEWIADLETAHTEWEDRKLSYAQSMYGEKAADAIDTPPPELLRLLGAKPMPVDVPRCCQAGNRWALGLSDKKPGWSAALFPDTQPTARKLFPDVDDEDDLPDSAEGFDLTEEQAARVAATIDDEDEGPTCGFCQEPPAGELSDGTPACGYHLDKFAKAEAEATADADRASGKAAKRQRNGRFARQEA